MEEEFVRFDVLDNEDEANYGIRIADINVPVGNKDEELLDSMLITN